MLKRKTYPYKRRKRRTRKERTTTTAIVRVTAQEQIAPVSGAAATIRETVGNLMRVRAFIQRAMNVDLKKRVSKLKPGQELQKWEREKLEIDWGTIPGIGKPFLKQPGAEKFMFWTQTRPKYYTRELDLGAGHMEVVNRVELLHKKTKEIVFEGPECSCSTMESNYRFRWVPRKGDESDPFPGKEEAHNLKGQGLGKWKKEWVKGENGRVESWVWYDRYDNPNIHDERNKVRQISAKRAAVKCCRNAGAMSEIFTEDPGEWDLPEDPDAIDVAPVYDPAPAGRVVKEQVSAATTRTQPTAGRPDAQQSPEATRSAGQKTEAPAKATAQTTTQAGAAPAGMPIGSASAPQAEAKKKKIVTVAWTEDNSEAIMGGDIAELLDSIKLAHGQWVQAIPAWVVPGPFIPPLWEHIQKLPGYQIQELHPVSQPKPEVAIIQKVSAIKDGTKKNVKYMEVLWRGNVWHSCFKRDLFDYLGQGVGQEAELVVDQSKPPKIVGIKRIGKQQFDETGPVMSVNREPGTSKSLFG